VGCLAGSSFDLTFPAIFGQAPYRIGR